MIIDVNSKLSNAQAITANAVSDNVIDFGAGRYIGTGTPVYLVMQVTTTFTDSGDNSNCTVDWQSSANANMAGATNTSLAVFVTNSASGTMKIVPLAPALQDARYGALYYRMGNGDLTAGAMTSFLTTDPQSVNNMAKGYTGPTFS